MFILSHNMFLKSYAMVNVFQLTQLSDENTQTILQSQKPKQQNHKNTAYFGKSLNFRTIKKNTQLSQPNKRLDLVYLDIGNTKINNTSKQKMNNVDKIVGSITYDTFVLQLFFISFFFCKRVLVTKVKFELNSRVHFQS